MAKTFFQRVAQEFTIYDSKKEVVEVNHEEKWINIKRGLVNLSIEFDDKGHHIERIGVFQDVVQVVDKKKIF